MTLLREVGRTEDVLLTSFHSSTHAALGAAGWSGPRGLSAREVARVRLLPASIAGVLPLGHAAQLPRRYGRLRFDSPRFIRRCHHLGVRVDFWTINDPDEAEELLELGADGIITDDPEALLPVFERRRGRGRMTGVWWLLLVLGCKNPDDLDRDGHLVPEDCNDRNAAIFPGAEEVCDDVDNDCDGEIDEADATDVSVFYVDGDADGYGDPDQPVEACTRPVGAVADGTDCDDTEALSNPGMDEICRDHVDNDCDGSDNGCNLRGRCGPRQTPTSLPPRARATAGRAGRWPGVGDVGGDGLDDLLIGAQATDSDRGAVYLLPGGATGDLDSAALRIDGEGYDDRAGYSVAAAGDVNGDGHADLLVGAHGYNEGYAQGAGYLVLGPADAVGDLGGAVATWVGEEPERPGWVRGHRARRCHRRWCGGSGHRRARRSTSPPTMSARIYAVSSDVTGITLLRGAPVRLTGEAIADTAGVALASVDRRRRRPVGDRRGRSRRRHRRHGRGRGLPGPRDRSTAGALSSTTARS